MLELIDEALLRLLTSARSQIAHDHSLITAFVLVLGQQGGGGELGALGHGELIVHDSGGGRLLRLQLAMRIRGLLLLRVREIGLTRNVGDVCGLGVEE